MARPRKAAAEAPPEWIVLPHALYAETCARLVTFSHKTANSNAPPGGIRLSASQALKLPYVSARTLLGAGETPALDYVANAGKTATAVKQLNQLREGSATAPPDEARQLLAMLAEATAQGCEIATHKVSMRARQLLLPGPDGAYRAVTPLSAGGVSRRIRETVRTHNERVHELQREKAPGSEHLQRIPLAILGLGGSNPQNVGSLVRDMQRPLVCFAPAENRQIKVALALHFQGLGIRLPREPMNAFRAWSTACRARNGGRIATDMRTRDEEIAHVRVIARAVLAQGAQARRRLLDHRDMLPAGGTPLVCAQADAVARGLIAPELRERHWPRAFAERLARLIADYRFDDGREEFHFDQADLYAIQDMIEEVVR
ncbi:type I-F CRISPR-associated protein Csy1 [Thauera butanivorans]|uniref:type I-F CRISPR-associated protein Csy1 n=1 Tax=Thauera butanivorans TaxID=86174 RepID=UPI003AB8B500